MLDNIRCYCQRTHHVIFKRTAFKMCTNYFVSHVHALIVGC